jgi:hypothetical protein
MTIAKEIPTNMLQLVNNILPFSTDPDMDMITFEHIDVHALNNTVSKKMRTLERPHSLMLDDDMPF